MDYAEPIPCNLTKGEVEAFAQAIVDHMGLMPGHPMDEVVHKLGGTISFQDVWSLGDTSDGSIRIEPDGSFQIFLALHTGKERDRFTVAHELGHYFLHYYLPTQQGRTVAALKAKRAGSGRVEWEANWFAAGFLMPEKQFSAAYEELGRDVYLVASRFGVSQSAARIRVETLGLS